MPRRNRNSKPFSLILCGVWCGKKQRELRSLARENSGLTQQELADKAGTTKSYISKIENNVKEARLSTLEKIVELGLGGKMEIQIKL